MTTEEKLQHFLDFCMEDARSRSAKMLDEYTAALEQTFAEHQADARRRAEQQVELESERIEHETNKKLSLEQNMETPEYTQLLEKQIRHAREFAGNEFFTIYIDPADETRLNRLALHNSADIRVSEYSFGGGTRAVIPSRHILIDDSFQTKLEEAKRDFRFNLKDLEGGITND